MKSEDIARFRWAVQTIAPLTIAEMDTRRQRRDAHARRHAVQVLRVDTFLCHFLFSFTLVRQQRAHVHEPPYSARY